MLGEARAVAVVNAGDAADFDDIGAYAVDGHGRKT